MDGRDALRRGKSEKAQFTDEGTGIEWGPRGSH